MLTNGITLTINRHDTETSEASSLGHSQIEHVTLNTITGVSMFDH